MDHTKTAAESHPEIVVSQGKMTNDLAFSIQQNALLMQHQVDLKGVEIVDKHRKVEMKRLTEAGQAELAGAQLASTYPVRGYVKAGQSVRDAAGNLVKVDTAELNKHGKAIKVTLKTKAQSNVTLPPVKPNTDTSGSAVAMSKDLPSDYFDKNSKSEGNGAGKNETNNAGKGKGKGKGKAKAKAKGKGKATSAAADR